MKGELPEDNEGVGTYLSLIQYMRGLDLAHTSMLDCWFDYVNPAYTPQKALGIMTSSRKTAPFLV